jgi:hypothetical protein
MLLSFLVFTHLIPTSGHGGEVSDTVATDAKRILLRYGAPISVLDKVSEADRIEFARVISRTNLPDREPKLRGLLKERGYTE